MTTAIATLPEKKVYSPKRYTLEEYLAREEKSKHKHEYYNGEIKLMAGGTSNHSLIGINTGFAIKAALKKVEKKFYVHGSDMAIYLPQFDFASYADALVVFEKLEFWENNKRLLINPLLIVEVASSSTRSYDRTKKFDEYRTLPSFKEYILIEQNKPQVESRLIINNNRWETEIETDMTKNIALRSLGIEISLEDIYENIEF